MNLWSTEPRMEPPQVLNLLGVRSLDATRTRTVVQVGLSSSRNGIPPKLGFQELAMSSAVPAN